MDFFDTQDTIPMIQKDVFDKTAFVKFKISINLKQWWNTFKTTKLPYQPIDFKNLKKVYEQ